MIELKNVSYVYPSADGAQHEASLVDIDFELNSGELVALVGPNGAGKSTLGRVLCGTYKPSAGSVLGDGKELLGDELHKLVGYVRQDPSSQLVAPTVFSEVAFGPCNLGLPEDEVRARISWALEAVGLKGFAERLVSELSGGELQRLSLAGVLAMKPRYLVLDEVTSQLDGASREQLRGIIRELAASGTGILSIAHDAIEVAQADRIVLAEAGKIAWQGAPRDFFANEDLIERSCLRVPLEPKRYKAISERIPTPTLLFENASVRYDDFDALSNVSLTAMQGQVLLVAGRSGSGKSTLASLASGLIKPDAGSVLLGGAQVHVGSVGLCMQRPEAQLFCDSVLDDVAFGPINQGLSRDEAYEEAAQALEAFGISKELWDASPFALSGGQRRRVALAGIVALRSDVFIFDEPTVGIDAKGCAQLRGVISKLAQGGKAVVVVSHDIEEWLGIADAVALLGEGKLIWQGCAKELVEQKLVLNKAGLGKLPWELMRALLSGFGLGGDAA